ncbi:radical SAM protein [Polyangium sp. 6x1]|uniref:radical SAM protein n=1 Tax=Polyangium sp. 6x1 TaxID=3042689 RepID=UPI002482DBC9|nr:radical SAM protein [Polyangium sp. 6x1]MDI1442808.1 radical SAM protein [Polyangium sp. 6x1]
MPPRPEDEIPLPSALAPMRRFALDGALLCFDRRTGLTAVCEGPETAHLRMRAPRVVQFSITNACNLSCTFCSRDVAARSAWTADEAFVLLRDLDRAGVLEVAFGGGEPLVFKGFAALVRRLDLETRLSVSLTTNGTRLDDATIAALAPHVGQIRLSVYDDVDHQSILLRLARSGVRFGVNWLVTPARLPGLAAFVLDLVELGCRDILLLSYNGPDHALHLDPAEASELARVARVLGRGLAGRATLKLDVCWGERMAAVPRLFGGRPCPAGREFVVVTSEKQVSPCSFHHLRFPAETAEDVLRVWETQAAALAAPAHDPGCARTPGYGLDGAPRRLPMTG